MTRKQLLREMKTLQRNKCLLGISLLAVSCLLFIAFADKTDAATTATTADADCKPGETPYPAVKGKWNLMAVPYLKAAGAVEFSTLFSGNNTIDARSYEGVDTDGRATYEKAKKFLPGEGFWFKSSADKLCINTANTALLKETKSMKFGNQGGLYIVTNPSKNSIKLSDINYKFLARGADPASKLSDALTKPPAQGKNPDIKMIAFWDTGTQKYTVYVHDIYKGYFNNHPEVNRGDNSALNDKVIKPFTGMWVTTGLAFGMEVTYTASAITTGEVGATTSPAAVAGTDTGGATGGASTNGDSGEGSDTAATGAESNTANTGGSTGGAGDQQVPNVPASAGSTSSLTDKCKAVGGTLFCFTEGDAASYDTNRILRQAVDLISGVIKMDADHTKPPFKKGIPAFVVMDSSVGTDGRHAAFTCPIPTDELVQASGQVSKNSSDTDTGNPCLNTMRKIWSDSEWQQVFGGEQYKRGFVFMAASTSVLEDKPGNVNIAGYSYDVLLKYREVIHHEGGHVLDFLNGKDGDIEWSDGNDVFKKANSDYCGKSQTTAITDVVRCKPWVLGYIRPGDTSGEAICVNGNSTELFAYSYGVYVDKQAADTRGKIYSSASAGMCSSAIDAVMAGHDPHRTERGYDDTSE